MLIQLRTTRDRAWDLSTRLNIRGSGATEALRSTDGGGILPQDSDGTMLAAARLEHWPKHGSHPLEREPVLVGPVLVEPRVPIVTGSDRWQSAAEATPLQHT